MFRLQMVIVGLSTSGLLHYLVSASTHLLSNEDYGHEWKPLIYHPDNANGWIQYQDYRPYDLVEYSEYPPYLKGHYKSSRGLLDWFLSKKTAKALRRATWQGVVVGAKVIRFPFLGAEKLVNAASYITSLGLNFSGRVVRDITSVVGENWKAIKAVRLPGLYTVLYFVGGVVSVVSEVEKTIMFLTNVVRKGISAAKAFGVYASLTLVSRTLGPVMRTLKLDCVRFKPHKVKVNKFVVDTIQTGEGRVCGISNLHAINNVTISRDDESFLIAKIPYAINHITIHFKAINVTDFSGLLLENTPMVVRIKQLLVQGRVSFQGGTLLRFMIIRLRVMKFKGFRIKITQKEDRTKIMDIIEDIEDIIGSTVKKTVNERLQHLGNKISEAITGRQ